MRSRITRILGAVAVIAATGAVGCKDSGSNVVTPIQNPSITIALSTAGLALTQGTSGTVTVTVTRNDGYTGAVDLTLEGAPAGVTPTFTPATVPAGTGSSTLALSVQTTVAAGPYTLTVRGKGSGVSDNTASLTLTVNAAQVAGFSLSVSPATVSVQPGNSATANVTIVRTGGFADAVALSVTGAPAGVTAVATPASVTGTTASVAVTAGANAAAGDYTLTIHGTATGVSEQTASFTVQVGSSGGTAVVLQFCSDIPIWVAIQNNGGSWTKLTPSAGNEYRFDVNTRGAVAVVMPLNGGFETTVVYGTAAELFGLGQSTLADCLRSPSGSKRFTGSVANLVAGQSASIALGDAQASVENIQFPGFTLENAPDGASDLIAARQTSSLTGVTTDKLILRRSLLLPTGSVIPVLDFGAAEAIAPATATMNLSGLGADMPVVMSSFISATNTLVDLGASIGTAAPTIYGFPAASLNADDVHQLASLALTADGMGARGVMSFVTFLNSRSETLGPALLTPTVTTLSATAPQRLAAQWAMQPQYPSNVSVDFSQTNAAGETARSVVINVTAAYMGTTATTWDVAIPDLSAAAYAANWGLQASTPISWLAMATNASSLVPLLGGGMRDGSTYSFASRSNASVLSAAQRAPVFGRRSANALGVVRKLPRR